MEATLSDIQNDLFGLQTARESVNRLECEMTELVKEVRSVRSESESALKILSERVNLTEECLSRQAGEVTSLQSSTESMQNDSVLSLKRHSQCESAIAQLKSEITALRTLTESAQTRVTAHETKLNIFDRTTSDVSELKTDLVRFASQVEAVGQLRLDIAALKAWTNWIDSLIVREFPPLFEEFRWKQWTLLWRGSRDGFGPAEFHRRCDGHANTLTLIVDTNGNLFGGFTPVKWQARTSDYSKGDDSSRSFLFTLKNPRGVPPRKFALKIEKKQYAIYCHSERGPAFGNGCLFVLNNCNANAYSYTTYFGVEYDSVHGGREADFLTGSKHFTVKEMEVFEITD
jgi:hypothetical protein